MPAPFGPMTPRSSPALDGEIDVAVGDEAAERLVSPSRLRAPAPGVGVSRAQRQRRGRRCGAAPAGGRPRRRRRPAAAAARDEPSRDRCRPPIRPRRRKPPAGRRPGRAPASTRRRVPSTSCRKSRRYSQTAAPSSGPNSVPTPPMTVCTTSWPEVSKREGVGRHVALQHAEQAAGEAGIGGGDDEGGELVERRPRGPPPRRERVLADRASMAPNGERTMRSAITRPTK